ncbi:MAG: hypothetical protein JXB13_23010 [Phycisphaerae bacterium]|nr:hypothetical protein [Phycisphaerae bacterium]
MDRLASLKSKVRGFRLTLARLTPGEREQLPTPEYRAEYNNVRKLVIEASPQLEKFMPPTVDDDVQLKDGLVARYVEIQTYIEQISQLLLDDQPTDEHSASGDEINPYE